MRLVNNPFINDEQQYQQTDIENEKISLIEAKNMIANVSYQEFMNCCSLIGLPNYLHGLYYLHYLAMKGEFVRMKNFIIQLQEENININKIINYNKIPEFNYASLIQTIITWNANTEIISYFIEHYNCDFELCDNMGRSLRDYIEQDNEIYIFPFTNILGYGEIPYQRHKIYRRNSDDFEQIHIFILNTFQNQLIEEEEQEEEQEEENIIVVNQLPNMNVWNDFIDNNINNQNENQNENQNFMFDEVNEIMYQQQPEEPKDNIENINVINNKVIEHISKMNINNDVQELLLEYLINLRIYSEEDLFYTKLYDDDLIEPIFEKQDIEEIWRYISKRSPNYVDGKWIV